MRFGRKQAAILNAAIATVAWFGSASDGKITITGPDIYVPTVTVTNEPDVVSLSPADVVYLQAPNYGMRNQLIAFEHGGVHFVYPRTTLNGTLHIEYLGVNGPAPHFAFARLDATYTPGPGDPPLGNLQFIQEVVTNYPKPGKGNSSIDAFAAPSGTPFYPSPNPNHVNGQLVFYDTPKRPCRSVHPPGADHIVWTGELMLAFDNNSTISVYDGIGWSWKFDCAPTRAGVTGPTPQVPAPTSQFALSLEGDAHYATPIGPADLTNLSIIPNAAPISQINDTNELTSFPAELDATLKLGDATQPIQLQGVMQFLLINRANHPTGTFASRILNMNFSGTVNTPSGPATMVFRHDFTRSSVGQTEVTDSQVTESGETPPPPGPPYAIESYFDAFTRISLNGGATFTNSTGSVHLDLLKSPRGWKVDGGGTWDNSVNWIAGIIPAGPGAEAHFNSMLVTAANAPAIVTLEGEHVIGTLLFDNTTTNGIDSKSYVLSTVAGGSLKLDNGTESAFIRVNSGRHSIEVPLNIASDTTLTVADGSKLYVKAPISIFAGKMLNKGDPGTLAIWSCVTLGAGSILWADGGWTTVKGIDGEGEVRVSNGAWLKAAHIQTSSLRIHSGATVQIATNGTPADASRVLSVDFDGGTDAWAGKLDLADNDLIVQAGLGDGPAALAPLTNQIRQGRNSNGPGTWTGDGIISSAAAQASGIAAADTSGPTGLGIILNNNPAGGVLYSQFAGLAVDADSILIKYTWNGDADLNGNVDADDYFRVDSGFANAATGWFNGDFDYSGTIDADDYFLIDNSFSGQDGMLGAAAAGMVPEPGTCVVLEVAAVLAMRRHWPRQRDHKSGARYIA